MEKKQAKKTIKAVKGAQKKLLSKKKSDLDTAYALMKKNDPGSVVRKSEYARMKKKKKR